MVYFAKDWPYARCIKCHPVWKNKLANTTLSELKQKIEKRGFHPSYRWSEVRQHCRKKANKHRQKICQVCGYSLHINFCHIKPLADWPESATVGEVNHPTNVLILCKNHHWEFDNGHLSVDEIEALDD